MLNKKGVAWSFILEFLIGLIILGLILGVFFPELFPYPSKLWNLTRTKIQGAFEPYEDELTNEEIKTDDSTNSLRCAINSIAVGKPGFSKKTIEGNICPGERISIQKEEENKVTSTVIALTGKAISKITGKATEEIETCSVKYGNICLNCKGGGSETVVLGIEEEKLKSDNSFISSQVADAVYNCFKKFKDNSQLSNIAGGEFFNCYNLDARQIGETKITKQMVIDQLKNNAKYDQNYVKDLTGGSGWDLGLVNKDQLTFTTITTRRNPYCVYYDLDIRSDDIIVGDCRYDLIDSMVCKVKDFNLPQDVGIGTAFTPKSVISVHGKPRWLVYYESFPQEKTIYWKKSYWGNLLSWNTLINVGLGAIFNYGFAKVAAAPAGREIAEVAAKEAQERVTKEIIETGGGYLARRFAKNGIYNSMRSLFIEEALKKIPGLTDDAAREITERILQVAGKKGGKVTFQKVLKKRLTSELDEVIEAGIKQGTIELQQKTKEELIEEIMQRMQMKTGDEVVEGLEGIFGKRMTKAAIKNIIRSESYDAFFKRFLIEGVDGIDTKALNEIAENSLKYLDGVAKLEGDSAVNELLQRSAAQLDDLIKGTPGETVRKATEVIEKSGGKIPRELFRGSVGMSWEEFIQKGYFKGSVHILKELQPIRAAKVGWFNPITGGPAGKIVASIGKTTIHLPAWVAEHRYPVLLLLILANEMDREQNREMIPIGSNTLGVTIPYLFGEDAKTYDLHSDASKYFITNKDKPEDRLYLASPCVSDFEVVKKTCTCVSDPLRWRWNFGGGLMDVEKGSIKLKPSANIRQTAIEEANSGKYGLYDAWKKAVTLYYELMNKGIDADKLPSPDVVIHRSQYLTNFPEWYKFLQEFPEWNKNTETKLPGKDISYSHLYDAVLFIRDINQQNKDIPQEEIALEMWVDIMEKSATDFLEFQTKPYSSMGDVEIGWFRTKREDINRDARQFIRYSPYIDTSEAVKVCDSRGTMAQAFFMATSLFKGDAIQNNPYTYPEYKIDCIEVIPTVKDGYCYDYFKTQERLKIGVIVAAAATDIVISVATGGTAAPIVFLATGAAAGLLESIISSTELWPLRG